MTYLTFSKPKYNKSYLCINFNQQILNFNIEYSVGFPGGASGKERKESESEVA